MPLLRDVQGVKQKGKGVDKGMHGRRTFKIDKAIIVSVCLHYHCSYLLVGNGLPKEVHRPLDLVGVDIRIVVVVKYL